jgi:hypothetical protein
VIAVLEALAAHGLPGARVVPFGGEPMTAEAWEALARKAATHGLGGLLADAVHYGTLPCTPEQRHAAAAAQLASMSGCLRLESALLEAVDALAAGGIEVLVLAGTVNAHLDYPDPSLRPFGDVDLLLREADLAAGRARLHAAGFRPTGRRYPDRLVDDVGCQVDLHTHVLPAKWARHVGPAELWRQRDVLELGGRRLAVLDRAPRLVAACLRAGRGTRLISVRDVAQQVLGHPTPDAVVELSRRWHVVRGVAAAIDDAWERFALADIVALSVWAARNHGGSDLVRARPRPMAVRRRWLVR